MHVDINTALPWGRTREEYALMFDLSEHDLSQNILACADGPASFNAEMHTRGGRITSTDPIYAFPKAAIAKRIEAARDVIMPDTVANQELYLWELLKTPENLERTRMKAMQIFLDDFEEGLRVNRYIPAALPELPFENDTFDLALCSHFLFTYTKQFDEEFHLAAVREMLRVAREARVFPLRNMDATPSAHLPPIVTALKNDGFDVAIRVVPYEFQRGSNEMLVVNRS